VSDLIFQSANDVGKPFDPCSQLLARRQEHFYDILMSEQALSERAVKPLNNTLIFVNFGALMVNGCFVVFQFFGHTSEKLVARVNLQQWRPRQRAVLVNRLKSLRNFSSLSRSEAQLLCNGWRRQQRSARICKFGGCGEACRVAEKEGPFGGPRFAMIP